MQKHFLFQSIYLNYFFVLHKSQSKRENQIKTKSNFVYVFFIWFDSQIKNNSQLITKSMDVYVQNCATRKIVVIWKRKENNEYKILWGRKANKRLNPIRRFVTVLACEFRQEHVPIPSHGLSARYICTWEVPSAQQEKSISLHLCSLLLE